MPKLDESRTVGFASCETEPMMALLPVRISSSTSGMQSWPAMAKSASRPACAGGVQHAEGAGISGGSHQDALALAMAAEKLCHRQLAGLPHSAALDLHEAVGRQIFRAAREFHRRRR